MDSFTASYSNLRRYINYQTKIPNDAVRTDELLNYFNYDLVDQKTMKCFL